MPPAIGHLERQAPIKRRQMRASDGLQKLIGLAITPKQNVLTIVDTLTGRSVGKRRCSTTQPGRTLNHLDAQPGISQAHRGSQAGTTGPDHHHIRLTRRRLGAPTGVGHRRPSVNHVLIAIAACPGLEIRCTFENTSKSDDSIRRSNSK